jgi:cytochrome c556
MMRVMLGMIVLLLAGAASAEESAAVKYRQTTMKAVGGHMGAIGAIAKGQVDHPLDLAVHVSSLAALSGIVPELFGEDAKGGDALPKIWSEPDEFKKRLDAFRAAATDLDALVKAGDTTNFPKAVGTLGQACKGCHDNFKKE